MKYFKHKIAFVFFLPLLFENCFYPTYEASLVNIDTLKIDKIINVQTKIVTSDNSTFLFPKGFSHDGNSIAGRGKWYKFAASYAIQDSFQINIDSITAIITYNETTSGGRTFGSFLMGLSGPPLTFLGVYCISCPKCCFGSCPTVYLYDDKNYFLQDELFSECISKQLENSDLDLLTKNIENDTIKIKITNEALETHYINKFEIVIADHPKSTELFPSNKDEFILFSNYLSPTSARNKDGNDILQSLTLDDNKYYRTGVKKVNELKKGVTFDFIDVSLPSKATKLLIKYRNTLLSTTLLYDVVIGSQGIKGIEWTKKMNEDPLYAAQFKMVYEMFSGIKIKTYEDGEWKSIGRFKDAGPLNWKYLSSELPNCISNDNKLIRLEFIPDNFMIDYIAYDISVLDTTEYSINKISPCNISDANGNSVPEIMDFIKNDDKDYLKTEPGDSYNFNFIINRDSNNSYSAFIKSKGYYNEWIRKSWIKNYDKNYSFDLYNFNETLSKLADSWEENCDLLEGEFFKNKILLKEGK